MLSGRRSHSVQGGMDANWHFWKKEGETFSQRFWHWINILDPGLLFESKVKIDQARTHILTAGDDVAESLQNKNMKEAWMLSLASVNVATGDTIPVIFRPPAFFAFTAPLIITALAPHSSTRNVVLSQLVFHGYTGGFSLANGNSGKMLKESTAEKEAVQKHFVIGIGSVLYSAFMGSLPQHILLHRKLQSSSTQFLLKNFLPGQLTALLCAFNLILIRSSETENGIEVMDSKGNVIGMSKMAGEKAVTETAISRGVMISTAVAIPDVVFSFISRRKFLIEKPHIFATLKSMMVITLLGLMIPVSFSWMPLVGKIERSELEPEIISSTEETELFYNRGL